MDDYGRNDDDFSGDFPMKLRYEYEREDDCQLTYAHGVWGGINPNGEIEMNFYAESDKLPEFVERVINADGSLGPEMEGDPNTKTIVRRVQNRIIINHQTARAVIDWLEEKAQALEMEMDHGGHFSMDDENGPAQ